MAGPLLNHLFQISVSGDRYEQGFSFPAVSATQVSEEIGIIEGKSQARGISGIDRLRLEYPVGSPAMRSINSWFKNICNARREIAKRTIDIGLNREDGSHSGFIRLRNAWPCRVGLSRVTQEGRSKTPLEFVEFAYEGIDRSGEERQKTFGDRRPGRPKSPPPSDAVLLQTALQKAHEMKENEYRTTENTPLGQAAWKEALKPPPNVGSIPEVRQAYLREVSHIKKVTDQQLASGWKKCKIADDANLLRRQIGLKYKNLTPESKRMDIYKRNWDKYSDPLGPKAQQLKSVDGKSWNDIIKASYRTNETLNLSHGVGK